MSESKLPNSRTWPESGCNLTPTGCAWFHGGKAHHEKASKATLDSGIDLDRFSVQTITLYQITCRRCKDTIAQVDYRQAKEFAEAHRGEH